jgi:hypothetical protein
MRIAIVLYPGLIGAYPSIAWLARSRSFASGAGRPRRRPG